MSTDSRGGIFDSLKALIDRLVAVLHGRAELLTTELEEEVARLIGVMLWSLVAVFAAIIGVTFLAVMALLFLPPEYRVWGAAVIAVLFLAFGAVAYRAIRRILRAKPRVFDASLRELEKDRQHLRGER
jgi:uncharacterized membrane protein YqjE